ncbi:tail X family protein [Endozoicomonas montiporae CL-33]|uniref:Tail X family protein n=1 Tax=Endozoicomonas montiporae CL-33 TaxID=570277 RepID=A0A142BH73_9GAMM|nr:tail protein X [Endozoicomonas montiporae]AMO58099.1 tail X family protein [Endozoicomonas montiporae CL-33]
MKYRVTDINMLDHICLKYYGRTDVVPQVLAANPRLAQMGAVLPAGVVINLPNIAAPKAEKEVRLWD